jgi:hypothetical protein
VEWESLVSTSVRGRLSVRALQIFEALVIGQLESILETESPKFQEICAQTFLLLRHRDEHSSVVDPAYSLINCDLVFPAPGLDEKAFHDTLSDFKVETILEERPQRWNWIIDASQSLPNFMSLFFLKCCEQSSLFHLELQVLKVICGELRRTGFNQTNGDPVYQR